MTEEDIKVKYVLPWLEQAGIALHEIQLERTFSLNIGRQSVIVGVGQTKTRKRDTICCRLDILVKRNGRNLLIFETKADGLQLTDDDRDQAISYARLVHPIAPYTVVTNGSDYRLYDSVTKARIDPKDINIRGYGIVLPDEDILDAQLLFFALNPDNLVTFCRSQVADELRIVKGALIDGRKYVPELHVPRSAIQKDVEEFFYRSSLPGLLLIGQSGFGKTCEMCWLAESLLDAGNPVLFFNGSALEAGITEAIAEVFSWTFNGPDLPIQVVRHIAKLAGRSKTLTIIVDAIDEWIYTYRVNHLSSLLSAAENNNIKIIASCKTSAVEQFTSVRGNPTKIEILTKKAETGAFSDREFFSAIDKYRQAYQFSGNFEDAVLKEASSNPFLLRVFFDVAQNSSLKHLTFSSAEFFDAYFRRSISRTADERQAEYTLKAIAGLLYQRNTDQILEDDIRTSLGLRVNESIMEELFEYGILLRSETETRTSVVSFYFQQLRDYIVAFKVQRFNAMSQQQLADEFEQVTELCVKADIFTLYYRLASSKHKIVFDKYVRENATRYLHFYTSFVQQHFPALREVFTPQTEGRIGFIGELLLVKRCLGGYGFRSLGETDNEVHFMPAQQVLGKSNLAYLDGADQLHWTGSACGFRDGINIKSEVINYELLPQLEQLIKEGLLNESHCPEMLVEFIVETVLRNKVIFKELLSVDGLSIRYPLKYDEVLKKLLRERLIRHYREELISTKKRSGEIKEIWDGSIVSYFSNLTAEEEKQILDAAEDSLNSGHLPKFHARYGDLDKLESSLVRVINSLNTTNIEINSPLFDGESKVKTDVTRGHTISDDDVKSYLVWLYSVFLENYKSIIETNFPTLKQHFQIYSEMPISIHLVLGSTEKNHFGRNTFTPLDKYFSESQNNINEVKVVDDLVWNTDDCWHFSSGGIKFQNFRVTQTSLEFLFFSRSGLINDAFKEMTLRKLVYGTIANEFKVFKKVLLTQFKD
ncbi:NACHT domain-containing protein [Methylovulum psychrotolerans]|uniref:type I restriction enzyme HsdR N-terminal domain-containing protein n=1 Tax=Methylovulum psychrotolerans TaxID=1704499 RepID=UPI0012F7A28C|nr:type I restriction enzyme HsdR N-terminal domain-containing protein [Methylovulum psychrotolerans]